MRATTPPQTYLVYRSLSENLDHDPLRPPPVEFGGGARASPLRPRDTDRGDVAGERGTAQEGLRGVRPWRCGGGDGAVGPRCGLAPCYRADTRRGRSPRQRGREGLPDP